MSSLFGLGARTEIGIAALSLNPYNVPMTFLRVHNNLRNLFAHGFFLLGVLATGIAPAWYTLQNHWQTGWFPAPEVTLMMTFIGAGPGVIALFAVAFRHGCYRQELGLYPGKPVFLLPAWLLFPLLALLAAALSVTFKLAEWDWMMGESVELLRTQWPDHARMELLSLVPSNGIVLWLFLGALGPLIWFLPAWLEETAWRGYVYAQMRPRGFWTTALAAGILAWSLRLPLLLLGQWYPDHPAAGLLVSLGFHVLISVVLTWLRQASGGILAPSLARASLMSSAIFPLSLTRLYDPLWAHLQGIMGIGVLLLFVLATWITGLFAAPKTPAP